MSQNKINVSTTSNKVLVNKTLNEINVIFGEVSPKILTAASVGIGGPAGSLGPTGIPGPTGSRGSTGPSANVYFQNTAPSGATANDFWFDNQDGKFYLNLNDGDSIQWVEVPYR